jgi:uncharacterized protein YjbI with pentapeptide repeats
MTVKTRSALAWGGGIAALLVVLAVVGVVVYGYAASPRWVGVADKTLWSWLDLLIIPFVLAVGGTVGGYFFTRSENRTAQAIAEKRAQDQAVQDYFNKMSELLLEDKHPLRKSKEDDEVRTLARARTLTVLKRLDAEHNSSVLEFLRDSDLIGETENPIILFGFANLRDVDLRGTFLALVDLRDVNLHGALLAGADLGGTNLNGADLREANLKGADLNSANLFGAILGGADLRDASLYGADLTLARLKDAKVSEEQLAESKSLEGATMPDGSKHD